MIQTQDLPAAPDPMSMVQEQWNQQAQVYQQQADGLMRQARQGRITPEEYNEAVGALQQEINQGFQQVQMVAAQMEQLNELSASGMIDPRQAQEAQWRLVMPESVAATAFKMPREEVDRAFSPQSMAARGGDGMNSLERLASDFIDHVIPVKEWNPFTGTRWWPGATEHYEPTQINQGLTEAYIEFKNYTQYDTFEPAKRRQLDKSFDMVVESAGLGDYWDPEEPYVQALRAGGPIGRAGASLHPTPKRTGWGQRIREDIQNKETKRQQPTKQLDEEGARAILQEAGGDVDRAREIARERGYKL